MKFNKWTLGLAAVGAVSMASAVRADEAKMSAVNTALSNTTISGYVDIGIQANFGNQQTDSKLPPYANNGLGTEGDNTGIRDGFSLNAVNIALDRPLDDSSWAAGYHVEINTGTGAINGVPSGHNIDNEASGSTASGVSGASSTGFLAIRQAYVTMRTPIGTGIDWKLGVFDGITGYESNTGYKNPNYTRSYGYIINPTTFTGIMGTYQVVGGVSLSAGVANRGTYQHFDQNAYNLAQKDFFGSLSLTAPESWGWVKGSALNLGTVQSFDNNGVDVYSANLSLATPLAGLKFGFAWDMLSANSEDTGAEGSIYGAYATFQATDKLSFALRGEYVDASDLSSYEGVGGEDDIFNSINKGEELTVTVEYDLWANVTSRAEFRWDHSESDTPYSVNNTANAFLLALNVVYKF
ncbi:MAG: hypothetical protein RL616_1233 [Verrucomicrobiota bacterium]